MPIASDSTPLYGWGRAARSGSACSWSGETAAPSTATAGSSGSTEPGNGDTGSSGNNEGAARTVTGSVAQTRWGPVQVQLTIGGGKITAASVPQCPDNNPRDQEINSDVLPILVQETLDAQSADIDAVSGATVMSGGYVQSLQAAIDEAGL
ncbi:MAG TPA: FMN-binding protein [Kribbella sp.]|nr:FMN-binding protein [Kribbella sp.]